jgi:Flp pilus assembly CpaF family ATPase
MIESLIGEAVDVIVHIARTQKGHVVREVLEVKDFDRAKQTYNLRPSCLKTAITCSKKRKDEKIYK